MIVGHNFQKPLICAYYFPNWHPDLRNDKWHGAGWTEWEVLKCARPRFPGHQQPKVPLWGYEDESDPSVMAKKIDAAAGRGVDGFIFDWYWFGDGPYRTKCLEQGFLKAHNCADLQFAIMWANHDPIYVHPGSRMYPMPKLLDGAILPETFVKATNHCIETYFKQPNYLRLDGGLYFSFFDFAKLVNSLGGEAAAGEVFRDFRSRVARAGLGEVNLNACVTIESKDETYKLMKRLGVNSCGSYGWTWDQSSFPVCDYDRTAKENAAAYDILTARCNKMPYYVNVIMGWDVSPRSVQSEIYENAGYPFMNVIISTPAQYEQALRAARDFVLSGKATGRMVTLNAWNEWTEGSYLEPDTINGMAYLEAVKKVFKEGKRE
ncbi:MAG: glycoside hydrolase family 99-like domain-containing protein [Verrucomicrobia bacterium]|nr:glycoside hydrolase family 99-like domain-containing protein [Verrucomicrobiota bacterium]MBU1734293.1 glycoside hydrolase family 99-like domain-containing protein [Verrucomicrobiota bacterium]MBU1857014.1 glycoside hydrolase family 99-like domain-containing protein [Verrucomicrobiota bacterium]